MIHIGDHGGESGPGLTLVGVVEFFGGFGEKFLFENGAVFLLPLFLGAEAGVRNLKGEVEEKGTVLLLFDVLQSFLGDDGGREIVAFMKGVFWIINLLRVPPEVLRKVEVGVGVGGVAEEVIEAFVKDEGGVVGVAAES